MRKTLGKKKAIWFWIATWVIGIGGWVGEAKGEPPKGKEEAIAKGVARLALEVVNANLEWEGEKPHKEAFEKLWAWVKQKAGGKASERWWKLTRDWLKEGKKGKVQGISAISASVAIDWLDARKKAAEKTAESEDWVTKVGRVRGVQPGQPGLEKAWRGLWLLLLAEVFEDGKAPLSRVEKRRLVLESLRLWWSGELQKKLKQAEELEGGLSKEARGLWRSVVIPEALQTEERKNLALWSAVQSGVIPKEWQAAAGWIERSYRQLGGGLFFRKAPAPLLGKAVEEWKDLVSHPLVLAVLHREVQTKEALWLWERVAEHAQTKPEVALGGGLLFLKARRSVPQGTRGALLEAKLLEGMLRGMAGTLEEGKGGQENKSGWGLKGSKIKEMAEAIGGWEKALPNEKETGWDRLREAGKQQTEAIWKAEDKRIQKQADQLYDGAAEAYRREVLKQEKIRRKAGQAALSEGAKQAIHRQTLEETLKPLLAAILKTQGRLEGVLKNPFQIGGVFSAIMKHPPRGLEGQLVARWWLSEALRRSPAAVGQALEEAATGGFLPLWNFPSESKAEGWDRLWIGANYTTALEGLRGRWLDRKLKEPSQEKKAGKERSQGLDYPQDPWAGWGEETLFWRWWKGQEGATNPDDLEVKGRRFLLAWLGIPEGKSKDSEDGFREKFQEKLDEEGKVKESAEEQSKGAAPEYRLLGLTWAVTEIGRLKASDSRYWKLIERFAGLDLQRPKASGLSVQSIRKTLDAWIEVMSHPSKISSVVGSPLGYRVAFDTAWLWSQKARALPKEMREEILQISPKEASLPTLRVLGGVGMGACRKLKPEVGAEDKCIAWVGQRLALEGREEDIPLSPKEISRAFEKHPEGRETYSKAANPPGLWSQGFGDVMWERAIRETRFQQRFHLLLQKGDKLDQARMAIRGLRRHLELRAAVTKEWMSVGKGQGAAAKVADLKVGLAWPWDRSASEMGRESSLTEIESQSFVTRDLRRQRIETEHQGLERLLQQHEEANVVWPTFSRGALKRALKRTLEELKAIEEARQRLEAEKQGQLQAQAQADKDQAKDAREELHRQRMELLLQTPLRQAYHAYGPRLKEAQALLEAARSKVEARKYEVEAQKLLLQAEELVRSLLDLDKRRLDVAAKIAAYQKKAKAQERQKLQLEEQKAALALQGKTADKDIAQIGKKIEEIKLSMVQDKIGAYASAVSLLKNEVEVLQELLVKPKEAIDPQGKVVKDAQGKIVMVRGKIGVLAYQASYQIRKAEAEIEAALQRASSAKAKAQERWKVLEEARLAKERWELVGKILAVVTAVAFVAVTVATGGVALTLPAIVGAAWAGLKSAAPFVFGIQAIVNIGGTIHAGVIAGDGAAAIALRILPQIPALLPMVSQGFGFLGGWMGSKALNLISRELGNASEALQYLPLVIDLQQALTAFQGIAARPIPPVFPEEQRKRLACLVGQIGVWKTLFEKLQVTTAQSGGGLRSRLFAESLQNRCKALNNASDDELTKACKALKKHAAACPGGSFEQATVDISQYVLLEAMPSLQSHSSKTFTLLVLALRFYQTQTSGSYSATAFRADLLKRMEEAHHQLEASKAQAVKAPKAPKAPFKAKEFDADLDQIEGILGRFGEKQGSELTWVAIEPTLRDWLQEHALNRPEDQAFMLNQARKALDPDFLQGQIQEIVDIWQKEFSQYLAGLQQLTTIPSFTPSATDEQGRLKQEIDWIEQTLEPGLHKGMAYAKSVLEWLQNGGTSPVLEARLKARQEVLHKEESRLDEAKRNRSIQAQRLQEWEKKKEIAGFRIDGAKLLLRMRSLALARHDEEQQISEVTAKDERELNAKEQKFKQSQAQLKTQAAAFALKAAEAELQAAEHRRSAAQERLNLIEIRHTSLHASIRDLDALNKGSNVPPLLLKAAPKDAIVKLLERWEAEDKRLQVGLRMKVAESFVLLRLLAQHNTLSTGSPSQEQLDTLDSWHESLSKMNAALQQHESQIFKKATIRIFDTPLTPDQLQNLFGSKGLLLKIREVHPKDRASLQTPVQKLPTEIEYVGPFRRFRSILWIGIIVGAGVDEDGLSTEPILFLGNDVKALSLLASPRKPRLQRYKLIRSLQESEHASRLNVVTDREITSQASRSGTSFWLDKTNLEKWLKTDRFFKEFADLDSKHWREILGLPMSGVFLLRVSGAIPPYARLVFAHIHYGD